MLIAKCDRCGSEKRVQSLMPIFGEPANPDEYPKYSIVTFGDKAGSVYLCKKCEKEFEQWLRLPEDHTK